MSHITNAENFYLNDKQRFIFEVCPRMVTATMSRRTGKTTGIAAPYEWRVWTTMPRGKGAIYCASYKQALTRTIPATIAAIEQMYGWIHGVHFFVGCKAPKSAGFPDPIVRPLDWEHCIHVYTGHVTHILSQDVPFSANSLTLDDILMDEARSMRPDKINEELMPALSGSPGMFNDNPLKKSLYMMSDRPLLRSELWYTDREAISTPGIVEEILFKIRERASYIANGDPVWAQNEVLGEINDLRRECHLYIEGDTIDNVDIVGYDYLADMKRNLSERTYRISILNEQQKRQADGFYPAYDEQKHTYTVDSVSQMDNMRIEIKPASKSRVKSQFETYDFERLQNRTCFLDLDIDPKQPLHIALDYNANINWIITGQKQEREGRLCAVTLSSMFEQAQGDNPDKVYDLRDVCEAWCKYYEPHRVRNRNVNYYYNQTAKQKKYANGDLDEKFYETVSRVLRSRGWQVNAIDMGQTMFHDDKYYMLIKAFQAQQDPKTLRQSYLYPWFNKENNEYLLWALENTGRRIDAYHKVQKDKSDEKTSESEDNPSYLRSDSTDAWDDLYIGLQFHFQAGNSFIPPIQIVSLRG